MKFWEIERFRDDRMNEWMNDRYEYIRYDKRRIWCEMNIFDEKWRNEKVIVKLNMKEKWFEEIELVG